jgi:DNA-binding NtrC family response regulator
MIQRHRVHTVLVVDDDPVQVRLLARVLGSQYEVLTAADAALAIEICTTHEWPISVIFSDVALGLENVALLDAAYAALRPRAAVVWTSGHDEEEVARRLGHPPIRYLSKPFRVTGLLVSVREALVDSFAAPAAESTFA